MRGMARDVGNWPLLFLWAYYRKQQSKDGWLPAKDGQLPIVSAKKEMRHGGIVVLDAERGMAH